MMRLRFLLIVVAFMGISFASVSAEEGATIRGLITDTTPNQNPIEGVEIVMVNVAGQEFRVTSDANGEFEKSGLPAGRYLLSFFKNRYGDRTGKAVTVIAGGEQFVPMKMVRQSYLGLFDVLMEAMGRGLGQRVPSLLPRVLARVGTEYGLDEMAVERLRAEILEIDPGILKQIHPHIAEMDMSNTVLLEAFLSLPDCRAVLTKYLSEEEYAAYMARLTARRERERQAVVDRIVVTLDAALSLTGTQRERVRELLQVNDVMELVSGMDMIGLQGMQIPQLNKWLDIPIEEVLTEIQAKAWNGLLDPLQVSLDIDSFLDDEAVGEKRRELAAAKLIAHTQQLGELDAAAARRLAIATKGVALQVIEAEDEVFKWILTLKKEVEAGEIDEKIAAKRILLDILHGVLPDDITAYPLYQQTIKDVLSAAAFAEYTAYQAERAALRRAAVSGLAVACLDAQLLLDAEQRHELETAFSRFTAGPDEKLTEMLFFQRFRQSPEHFERLTPWQQVTFERFFDPLIARGDEER